MKEVYSEKGACRAVNLFQKTIQDRKDKKTELSNKALVIGCIIAYKGECSYNYLKRTCPVSNINDALSDLISSEIISEVKEDKYYRFNGGEVDKSTLDININSLFLFANALMNVQEYISAYKIGSWNILAMVIETTLLTSRSTNHIVYGRKEMNAVTNPNNTVYRKRMELYGFIKPVTAHRSRYRLNKYAYLLGTK